VNTRLTPAETTILRMLIDGAPNKTIARERGCSVSTVKNQVHSIFAKIGVQNRIQAAVWAARNLEMERDEEITA
jgi:DNA-binding NarL/FixJ family response regulator